MKKHLIALLLASILSVNLIACGSNTTNTDETSQEKTVTTDNRPEPSYDKSTLEGILSGIETDFESTIDYLQTSFGETNITIGDTYEGYLENKQVLLDWYNFVLSEENALFERTKANTIDYFKLISSSIDHEDDDRIDDAMDDFYDKIYDDAMDDFYDDIYDNLMDDVYDTYYDGIVEDGYDVDPHIIIYLKDLSFVRRFRTSILYTL